MALLLLFVVYDTALSLDSLNKSIIPLCHCNAGRNDTILTLSFVYRSRLGQLDEIGRKQAESASD